MRLVGLRRFLSGWLFVGAYNVLQIASCIAAVTGAHRARLRTAFEDLGLHGSFWRAATFSFVAALPMLVAFWLSSPLNTQINVLSVAVGCFLAPFAEELLFRGYMFGQLFGELDGVFGLQQSFLQCCLRSDMLTKAVTL